MRWNMSVVLPESSCPVQVMPCWSVSEEVANNHLPDSQPPWCTWPPSRLPSAPLTQSMTSRLTSKLFIKRPVLRKMISCSCSLKDKSPMNDSSSTSMISLPQVKLPNCTPQKKRRKSSTSSEVRSSQRERLTPETTPTAGTGTSIRSSKNYTCPSVSPLLVNPWEEEPDSSPPWLTAPSLIGSSHGPRMPCSMSLPDSWRRKTLVTNLSDRPSLNSCPSHSIMSINSHKNSMKSKEDMFTPLPNPSSNLSNSSRACSNKRETVSWKTEKDMRLVLSSLKKLPNKWLSLKSKSKSRVLKQKKRKSKLINLLQKLKSKRKKSKFKTTRLKFKHPSVVSSRTMSNQRKPSQNKNLRLPVHWSNKPKKPWTQSKRRTSKSLSHSPILQEVFHKSSQPPFGFCQASLRKLMPIPKLKSRNSSIGKLLKSLWRIPMLSWLPCLDLSKS